MDSRQGTATDRRHRGVMSLLYASAATLFATPATALELGEINVESSLGQPLRASVPYALNAREELHDFCISLAEGQVHAGIPALTRATISVSGNNILINGKVPIMEPLLSMRLTVNCPYSVNLTRQYTLLMSPVAVTRAATVTVPAEPAASQLQPGVLAVPTVRAATPRPTVATTLLQAGAQYRVQNGDTLAKIAARIEDSPVSTSSAAKQIFAANPEAFIDGNINLLKSGSLLNIPLLQEGAVNPAVSAAPEPVAEIDEPETIAQSTASDSVYSGFAADDSNDDEPAAQQPEYKTYTFESADIVEPTDTVVSIPNTETNAPVEQAPAAQPAPADTVFSSGTTVVGDSADSGTDGTLLTPDDDTAVLSAATGVSEELVSNARPGDLFIGAEIPADAVVEPVEDATPVVALPTDNSSALPSWIWWSVSTALALLAAFLILGRRIRDLFGRFAAQPDPSRPNEEIDATATNETLGDIDFQLGDTAPGEVDITLDADLGAGTGLQESEDIQVAQDFGFSAEDQSQDTSTELDMIIFPEENQDNKPDSPTDIIAPPQREEQSILDEEVMPETSDDFTDYDLSMIVDATKQPIADIDGTAKELNAVAVDGALTMAEDVARQILEQDYQEEYTATLALNDGIEEAAKELARTMNDPEVDVPGGASAIDVDFDVLDLGDELTAQLPDAPIESSDSESTGINEAVVADSGATDVNEALTSEVPALDELDLSGEITQQMRVADFTGLHEAATTETPSGADLTSVTEQLSVDQLQGNDTEMDIVDDLTGNMFVDDATAEMQIESGEIDTKKNAS